MSNSPPLDPALQDFFTQCEQAEQARIQETLARLKQEIFPRLISWGVAKVHAEYSGYGDSGSINFIAYLDSHDQPMSMDLVRPASDPALEQVLYEFLPCGFETGDGGQGDIYLDAQTGTIKLEHQENYTETRDSTKQWEA